MAEPETRTDPREGVRGSVGVVAAGDEPAPITVTRPGTGTARIRRRWAQRPTIFMATPGSVLEIFAPHQAGTMVPGWRPGTRRVFLVGDRPGGDTAYAMRRWALGELPPGWSHDRHYLDGTNPVFRYIDPDGERVEVLRAAQWFGEGDYSPQLAADAWAQLDRVLVHRFPEPMLLSSPSATGRYLWRRSIAFGDDWPLLNDGAVELLHDHFGQGRFEVFNEGPHDQVVAYDARWSYAALLRVLPAGVARRRIGPQDYDPYRRGFYRVRVTDWPDGVGVGLLPATDGTWPVRSGFESWCEGAELLVAARAGVRFEVRDSVLFERARKGPLDLWAERLCRCRDEALSLADAGNPHAPLVLAAVRSIILHTIGSLWGSPYTTTRFTKDPNGVPPGARELRVEGDHYAWTEAGARPEADMVHPELSAAIWGRGRARLLDSPGPRGRRTGLLHVPARQLVGCRADAIYMATDPGWIDDGKIGRYRKTMEVQGPVTVKSQTDLIALSEGNK